MEAVFQHEKLDVYQVFLQFAGLSGAIVASIGGKAVIGDHLDRATESIGANLIRGNSQWSGGNRARSLDVSFASTLECAACLDVGRRRDFVSSEEYRDGKVKLWRIASMLFGLRKQAHGRVRETEETYGVPAFSHEKLDVYIAAMDFVKWFHLLISRTELKQREIGKLDKASTGVVLNIAEGNGRFEDLDHVLFLDTAYTHALQCVLALDLMGSGGRIPAETLEEGKAIQHRICSMLVAWRNKLSGDGRL